ncbi:pseudouridine-5'-phosphatase [Anabrus simplex]|uniref:pseudouridine-5'-phosphatase n=1 Tax=Anabrus simplex TaxID=316456 RepID=UPI0035A32EBA
MGTTEKDTARIIVEHVGLPVTVDAFLVDQSERLKTLLPTVKLMPGAERLIKHLHQNKIPIAIATSSSQPAYDLKASNYKALFALFHHIVAGGTDPEVKHGKPAPDIFLVCASRFPGKPPPDKVLVLEDAPNGVQAAVAAGMQVVMVPDPKLPADRKKGATIIINSLMDFKPEMFGLPRF